jgi:hypothetical protein
MHRAPRKTLNKAAMKEPLQIRIPSDVKRRFKAHAALCGQEPNELFVEMWEPYMADTAPLTDRERRRRVVLLCCSFIRNLAFYRAGQSDKARPLLSADDPHASFWRQASANFLDTAVLDWCKLFGDKSGEHYWSRVVADAAQFEADLLDHIGMDAAGFEAQIKAMRHYRDKFIAHLDNLRKMDVPHLGTAKKAVAFYHRYLLNHEIRPGDLTGIPADSTEKFALGYEQCVSEAVAVFRACQGC